MTWTTLLILILVAIIIILSFWLYNRMILLHKNVEEQYKDYIKESTFSKVINKLKEYSLLILLSIGLSLIVYYFVEKNTLKSDALETSYVKDLFSIGLAITSSGIFLAALKWFQFMGFFREELNKIISSSEFESKLEKTVSNVVYSDSFLEKQKDLHHLWSRVNRALFKNQFPDHLAEKVEMRMQDVFFHNKKLSHYYRNYHYLISVDLDGDDFLTIREKAEARMIRQDQDEFEFDFKYYVEKLNESDSRSGVLFHSVLIGNIPWPLDNLEDIPGNEHRLMKRLPIKLKGSTEYDIKTEITLTYNITKDFEYQLYCERFIDYLRVEVCHSSNIRVIFLPLGNEEFEEIAATDSGFVKVFRNILLPEKGFRLIFVKT